MIIIHASDLASIISMQMLANNYVLTYTKTNKLRPVGLSQPPDLLFAIGYYGYLHKLGDEGPSDYYECRIMEFKSRNGIRACPFGTLIGFLLGSHVDRYGYSEYIYES